MTYKTVWINTEGNIVSKLCYVDETLENVLQYFEYYKTRLDWKYYVIYAGTRVITRITKS